MHAHRENKKPILVECGKCRKMPKSKGKERAEMFSSAEQTLLMEVNEENRDIITKQGNTAAMNKARHVVWQNIADRLNV